MQSSDISSPIFFWEPNDLLAFDSVKEACLYLEPEDVSGGRCTGFDSEGRGILAVLERAERRTLLGADVGTGVQLVLHRESDLDEERMREIFAQFLRASGEHVDSGTALDVLRRRASELGKTR